MKKHIATLFLVIGATVSASAQTSPAVSVSTIRPQIGPGVEIIADQPATVDAYFNVSLLSSQAGTIQFLQKDIGDTFTAGEKLVEIDLLNAPGSRVALVAPFDGVVAARSSDPGAFVASAAVVPDVKSILDLQRTDIVTVGAQVPESFATYLDENTRAEIRIDALPGRIFVAKPTRYSPNFTTDDRTRQVQIDLFNGTAAAFEAFTKNLAANPQNNLKGGKMPALPGGLQPGESAGLMPGMFGSMRLIVTRFKDVPVISSAAILRQGGVPYLVKVENGIARKKQIAIEAENAKTARVRWSEGGQLTELTTQDEIVAANGSAIEDGTPVTPTVR